ncbi:DUF6800 family protein [Limnoglobus roseus]|uniref:Uncharacterized protein n=1 Tax=Limnoglobus roseus TaxID=2598579 RepID=A0A5C1AMJ3_9BACT|nr:DUF6800 family protein [Limnoglobus roseus]QEL19805.1 hypothetical protein PX52LOC_06884 [Limnoglobus roseus]
MIERQIELGRRYHRQDKMRKLKKKLVAATGEARDKILYKIKRISPYWTEASLKQAEAAAAGTATAEPKAEKKKAAPKKKA